MSSEGWMDVFISCVFSETPPPLVKSTRCMFFDAFRFIAVEFRGHCLAFAFSVSSSCAAQGACAAACNARRVRNEMGVVANVPGREE